MPLETTREQVKELTANLELPSDSLKVREEALVNLEELGLPSKRDEYWKYTDPKRFCEPLTHKTEYQNLEKGPVFEIPDCIKLVFTDGLFNSDKSDSLEAEDLEFSPISSLSDIEDSWASDFYGTLEREGQTPVNRPLAMINTAYAKDGVTLLVNGDTSKPVHLIYENSSPELDVNIHHCIKVKAGASLTLIESGQASLRFNKVLELEVSEGGSFQHVCVQGNANEKLVTSHLFAKLAENGILRSFTLTTNGGLTRNEHIVGLNGRNAIAHLAAASIGQGNFHHDDTVFITHNAENCESRQVFKKVLKGGAVGVFQGKILVTPEAQKTDGYQISKSLLLDDKSQFLAKPELEIYADDVICSHGSTSGAIEEDSLFYLKSRGIPDAKAKDLLVLAFLAEAIDELEDKNISNTILDYLEKLL
jgi:Fe-S cluster assembly protein SufD